MRKQSVVAINGIEFQLTCSACPEQYDAYHYGLKVGYLRLRHGMFTVEVPDCGDRQILQSPTVGDGEFEDRERWFFLTVAANEIRKAYNMPPIVHAQTSMEDTREYLEALGESRFLR